MIIEKYIYEQPLWDVFYYGFLHGKMPAYNISNKPIQQYNTILCIKQNEFIVILIFVLQKTHEKSNNFI